MEPLSIKTEAQASDKEKDALEAFENICEQAQENFLKDGELAPVVFIGTNAGDKIALVVIPANYFMQSVETKDKLEELMRSIGHAEPLFISMVTEAWVSIKSTIGKTKEQVLEDYHLMPPSKDPDREEVLMFTFETENIQKMVGFKIKRDPLSLEEWIQPGQADHYEGRFVNVLKNMRKIKYN